MQIRETYSLAPEIQKKKKKQQLKRNWVDKDLQSSAPDSKAEKKNKRGHVQIRETYSLAPEIQNKKK